jgi:elongation factor G
MPANIRNLAILAHIDAGKTTLSERILYLGREISALGEVEDGLATMDYLSEEKKRGITIEAGVARIHWKNTQINFIDTPGHVDFGVEVDCALDAIDGAILVVSGIRNLQTQSFSAWNKLRIKKKPCLFFINKLDLPDAQYDDVLLEIEDALKIKPLILTHPHFENGILHGILDIVNQVYFPSSEGRLLVTEKIPSHLIKDCQQLRQEVLEEIINYNDELATSYLKGEEGSIEEWYNALRSALLSGECAPVFSGSAKTNLGVRNILNAVKFILPHPEILNKEPGKVGKIIKVRKADTQGNTYLFYPYQNWKPASEFRLYKLHAAELLDMNAAKAAELCALKCTFDFCVGDEISGEGQVLYQEEPPVYDSLLSVALEPNSPEDQAKLSEALRFFSLVDPSLKTSYNNDAGRWVVATVGEVHLEVLVNRLKDEFACFVEYGNPEVTYFEKYIGGKKQITYESTLNENAITLEIKMERSSRFKSEYISYVEHPQKELIESVLRSSVEEFCQNGYCGKGEIGHFRFLLKSIRSAGQVIPGLLKKSILDAIKLHLKEEDFQILEPFMDIDVITPDKYCGVLLADLKSRKADINQVSSNGKITTIKASISMIKTFGYTTWMRHITKGMASFSMNYHDHLEVQA